MLEIVFGKVRASRIVVGAEASSLADVELLKTIKKWLFSWRIPYFIGDTVRLTKNFKGGTRHVIYPWNQSQIENLCAREVEYAREVEVSKILKKEHLSRASQFFNLKSKI